MRGVCAINQLDTNKRRFYGRRQGRPLTPGRQRAVDSFLPDIAIDDASLTEDGGLPPSALFPSSYKKIIFEIGFGNGERLAEHMLQQPENAYLGAEPFINGMSAFLKTLSTRSSLPPKNLRVIMDDAMRLAHSLTDACVDDLYILNPDPWHKARHHKRRMVNPAHLDTFARILKPGGRMILSTDVPALAEWMAAHTVMHPAFEWTARDKSDWETPPAGWIHTRYETKGAKGAKKMVYMLFSRT